MRAIILLATLAVPTSGVAQRPQPVPQIVTAPASNRVDCLATTVQHARPAPVAPRMRRLDELPAGQLYHSVMRQVDGCQELVLVSQERSRR